MKHVTRMTQQKPAAAISLIEWDGISQMMTRLFATLTSGVNFWNLLAKPDNEVSNTGKGF